MTKAYLDFMYRGWIQPRTRLGLVFLLAFVGLIIAFVLVTHHAPRRVIEAEMALPALLLLAGGTSIGARAGGGEKDKLAPLIAIVGCDGSGKSTLSTDMRDVLSEHRNTEVCYLGLGSGELGNRISRWPLIGPAIERRLARKAQQTRSKDKTIPGLFTALVVFGFSLLRMRRFRHVLALRRRGVTVITDRYPQTEVTGFYDGPGLSAARAGSPLVAWLAARERRMYEYMASYRPDIVLRLNVDAETALRRKPDHKPGLLAEKVRVTPLLRFHGARIVDLDATAAYDQVRAQAFARVRPILSRADRTIRTAA
jgi:thymidylate kinase